MRLKHYIRHIHYKKPSWFDTPSTAPDPTQVAQNDPGKRGSHIV